ncbi:PucR family transcriptional regulator [Clostridia bacterium]|nr:PucR family transcriptional regulator [Clostridia bacterium]
MEKAFSGAPDKGKGLKFILDTAYRLLGNPVVMIDTSYNLLLHTENTVSDDPLWNELVQNGVFSHATVDFFNTARFIQSVADADVIAVLKSERLKYDRACGKFFDRDGIQLGSIITVACYKPFAAEDFKLMEAVCEEITEEIQADNSCRLAERVFHESFISDLIRGNIQDKSLAESGMESLYENLKSNLYIAVADISRYEHTLSHLAYLRDLFARLQNTFKYFIHLNNIVVLISTDKPVLSIKKDLAALHDFFLEYNIFAGLSDGFQNLLEASKNYKQALCALNYGMSQPGGRRIFRYDRCRIDDFLNNIKDSVDITELCSPTAVLMRESDRLEGTEYADTLYAYLQSGKNTALTCAQTHIQPDALLDRLNHMASLFEIDWDDGDLLSGLLISFKALDCFK